MAQLKDTTITGGLSVSGTVNITGATQTNNDVTLYKSTGDSPSIIFQRGTLGDTLNDYKITDVGGYLKVKQQGNSSTSGFTQVAELTNQGTFTVSTPPATDTTPSVTAWISPTDSSVKISTDATIASGDKLVIRDSSDSNKMRSSSISFGSSTTTYLRNDGTWGTPSGGGLFLVNFSSGATLGSYTADKSFAQIVSAIDSGSVVMGQYQGEYFSLTYFSEGDEQTDGDVRFERYSNNLMSMEWFGMDSQGQVTYGNESPWETYTDNAIGNAIAALY